MKSVDNSDGLMNVKLRNGYDVGNFYINFSGV